MDAKPQPEFRLVQLPEECLVVLMRCCADDPRSLFSAARAHSSLHHAATLVLSSISAKVPQQQQADSVSRYLSNHGQHVSSIDLEGSDINPICQLDYRKLQGLSSLKCSRVSLQLRPVQGVQGALGALVPLKQLQLDRCKLLDGELGLAAALSLLPELQHLSLTSNTSGNGSAPRVVASIMQQLQQLTCLEVVGGHVQRPTSTRPLHRLTRLQDLRLERLGDHAIYTSMSGLQHLTRFRVLGSPERPYTSVFEPGALADMTQLQHLEVVSYRITGGSHGMRQLLSNLEPLQQLTHLDLKSTLHSLEVEPPARAYSALTASSKLQYLNISGGMLPAGVCQQLVPPDRQLPNLRELVMGYVEDSQHQSGFQAAPDGTRLVSCCRGLRSLLMPGLRYSVAQLSALTGLSSLQGLHVEAFGIPPEGLEEVCQLTGLRKLQLGDPSGDEGLLLRLSQLQQLTHLEYDHLGHRQAATVWQVR
jgi:hypothetical protein